MKPGRVAYHGHEVLTDRRESMTVMEIDMEIFKLGGLTWENPICVERPRILSAGQYSVSDTTWDIVRRPEQLAALRRKIMDAAEIKSLRFQVLDVRRQDNLPAGKRAI